MLIEIYRRGNLIRRETEILNTLTFDNELMLIPSLDLTFPIDRDFDGREEVKVFVNDKCFWGIVKEVEQDKVNETVSITLDHIISEWEYRQISINHAMDNQALNFVYKGEKIKKDKGNDETITANDFSIASKRISKMTVAKWVEKANAQAWVTSNGDKVKITKVDTSKVKKKEGEYDITFSTAKGTSVTVKVTVEESVHYQTQRTESNKNNKETIAATPFTVPLSEAEELTADQVKTMVKAKAWVYRKKKQSVAVTSITTNFKPEVGEYQVTASTAKGTSITVKVEVTDDGSSYDNVDASLIDKLEDIYSDNNFAYPGWEIDFQDSSESEMIDYVYSKQNKLEALTKTMELTADLFWRVGFINEKKVEIGKFGKTKPYILSEKPSGNTNIQILEEPTIRYDFKDVINIATVYSNKSDTGMSNLTLREVYNDKSLQIKGFPVVILREGVNNERSYTKYGAPIDQPTILAPNNELEYSVLDEESIALESGTLIEGSFAFDDLSPFRASEDKQAKKVTKAKRIKAAKTVYNATVKKLKNSQRSYDMILKVEELPADIWPGDRVRLIYDNSIWNLDACSNYWKKILSYDDLFYVTKIHYEIDENEVETNEITISKFIKIDRESSEQ